jgi:LuxR family transcriptional regulator, maltose regulon positive regulatory protein
MLLAEWAGRERRPVGWVTLDDLDNDPSVFLSYLAVAIDRIEPIDPSIASAVVAPGSRILATAVPRLAHALHAIGRPAVLVLDDAHRLTDRTCLDALTALLDYLPAGFQVAITGRTEPDLPLGRVRARRELLEITRDDLALDGAETRVLAAAAGLRLTADEALSLAERTEGWAAGIYLAALAGERAGHTGGTWNVVSGRDGYIADYIRSELRADFADDDIALLTRTSIFEVVEPLVAEAVVGVDGAAARLRSLAHTNQLIGGVAGPETTYRYHNLLRDYLRAELERREPGATPGLHRRASAWYAAAGRTELAIEHALQSDDADAAARLVTAAMLPTLYGGHGDTLDRWLRSFDDAAFERYPPLAVVGAWVHLLHGRPEPADHLADIAERSTFEGAPGDGSASFESGRATLRAIMGRHGPEDMLANARASVAAEQPGSPWRTLALYVLGSAHVLLGDEPAADAALADAVDEGAMAGSMVALAKRSSLAMARGDWTAAERFARESRSALAQAAYGNLVTALLVYAVSARVSIRRGDLPRAREVLVLAQLARASASHAAPWFSVDALLELARAYLAVSDPSGAQNAVAEAEAIARRRPALGTLAIELAEMRRRLGEARQTLAGSSSLTRAELRLLPILSTHLTFQEVAERLGLSRHTVKTQAISIYGKLGASSRSEAIERAVELGLLDPFPGLALARGPSGD